MRKAGDVTYADIRDGEGYFFFIFSFFFFFFFSSFLVIQKFSSLRFSSVVEFSTSDDMKRAIRKLDDEDFKGRRIRIREVCFFSFRSPLLPVT